MQFDRHGGDFRLYVSDWFIHIANTENLLYTYRRMQPHRRDKHGWNKYGGCVQFHLTDSIWTILPVFRVLWFTLILFALDTQSRIFDIRSAISREKQSARLSNTQFESDEGQHCLSKGASPLNRSRPQKVHVLVFYFILFSLFVKYKTLKLLRSPFSDCVSLQQNLSRSIGRWTLNNYTEI